MPRKLREEESYRVAVEALRLDAKRLDDQLRALTWAIATDAELCHPVPGTSLRAIKTEALYGSTALIVYFEIIDEDTCALHYIARIESDEEE